MEEGESEVGEGVELDVDEVSAGGLEADAGRPGEEEMVGLDGADGADDAIDGDRRFGDGETTELTFDFEDELAAIDAEDAGDAIGKACDRITGEAFGEADGPFGVEEVAGLGVAKSGSVADVGGEADGELPAIDLAHAKPDSLEGDVLGGLDFERKGRGEGEGVAAASDDLGGTDKAAGKDIEVSAGLAPGVVAAGIAKEFSDDGGHGAG